MDWSDEQQKRWTEISGSAEPPFVEYTQSIAEPLRITPNRMHASDAQLRRFAELVYGEWNPEPTPFLGALSRSLPRRPPPSRYTRLRWRLRAAERRAGDAWRVLWHGLPEHDD